MNLIQLQGGAGDRRVAWVDGARLRLIRGFESAYALAWDALSHSQPLRSAAEAAVKASADEESLDYDAVYAGKTPWRILPAFDHPGDPAKCMVSGTGLTHVNSAKQRDAMHAKTNAAAAPITDSMKIFQWGLEGGRPAAGSIGVQPEWFYKGSGHVLRGCGETLEVPAFADDGGEEPELAGAYLIDPSGRPRRVGMMIGNEFSDHQMERKNYLYLAPSKLRTCAVGPELVLDFDFKDVRGHVKVERAGKALWERDVASGEANMCHSLENLEHHHFKYPQHRVPGEVHIHFWGADAFSFGTGVLLQEGDVMEVLWAGYGRALRNPIKVDRSTPALAKVTGA